MSTTPPDLMDRWATTMEQASQLARDWWDQSQAMMEPWRDVVTGMATSAEPDARHHDHDHDHDQHARHHDHDQHARHHDHDQHAHRGDCNDCGCHDCDGHHGRHRGRGGHQSCGCEKRDARAGSAQHHGSSCRRADADVLVRARAGERRVIPFVVRSSRRRERTVTLEVGPWHACCSDELIITTAFDTASPLELGPCDERVVRLLIDIQVARRDVSVRHDSQHAETEHAETEHAAAEHAETEHAAAKEGTVDREAGEVVVTPRTWGGDVLCCATTYADVRFDGCARPVRVAIEVCPADCGAVDLTCSCGCC